MRGSAPQNFFALLRDGLEVTFARFPGLGIARKVPCCGHGGEVCPHEFDLKQLEKALTRTPPVNEIQCPEAFENVPIAKLLFGIDRDTTQQRLDELLGYAQSADAKLGKISRELAELTEYAQREFTKLFNAEQNKEDSRDSKLAGALREGYTPQQVGGAMLRALKLLLEEKDKQQTWGGLKRILTKEGHHLWLCPHHLAEYKQ